MVFRGGRHMSGEGQGDGDEEGDPLPTEIDIDTEVTGDITLDVYPPYV